MNQPLSAYEQFLDFVKNFYADLFSWIFSSWFSVITTLLVAIFLMLALLYRRLGRVLDMERKLFESGRKLAEAATKK
jgi:hypothetical protein